MNEREREEGMCVGMRVTLRQRERGRSEEKKRRERDCSRFQCCFLFLLLLSFPLSSLLLLPQLLLEEALLHKDTDTADAVSVTVLGAQRKS